MPMPALGQRSVKIFWGDHLVYSGLLDPRHIRFEPTSLAGFIFEVLPDCLIDSVTIWIARKNVLYATKTPGQVKIIRV